MRYGKSLIQLALVEYCLAKHKTLMIACLDPKKKIEYLKLHFPQVNMKEIDGGVLISNG